MLKGPALGEIIADAGARVLAISAEYGAAAPDIVAGAPALEHVVVCGDPSAVDIDARQVARHVWAEHAAADEAPVADTTAESPGFWLYSSGTTGRPKGVMHRQRDPQATFDTYARAVLRVTADDRFLSVAKLFFAFGLGNALTFPLGAGATAILHPDPPTPRAIAELIAAESPTLFFSSPGFCAALLDADQSDESGIAACLESAAFVRYVPGADGAGLTALATVHDRDRALVGRVRRDNRDRDGRRWCLTVAADNLRLGAATNAVRVASVWYPSADAALGVS